jgi:hypothetical protein
MICPTTGNCRNGLLSALALFAFTWAFDFIVHGHLFMNYYEETAALWRPQDEMRAFLPWCIAMHGLLALVVAGAYQCWRSKVTVGAVGSCDCPYRKSMGFGLVIGLIVGITWASAYFFQPIPEKLALLWLISSIVKWTLAGIVLNLAYRPKAVV